ncbi:MAG: neutral/alkaline non-lysosomal ceramidase N-terminal domain-containing protein, partial [Gordonia sp. (in: high G+C Gram-positive bacteria)]
MTVRQDSAQHNISRRGFLGGAAAGVIGTGLVGAASAAVGEARAEPATDYLVGAGKGDLTGAIAGQGMMGYSDLSQVASGLLSRTWARAYIIVDRNTGRRVAFVNADIGCVFESHRIGLVAALRARYGDLYRDENVNINATHNHNSCGGTSWDYAYSLAARGFRKNSYRAEIAGLLDAVVAAHNSLAPGTLELGFSDLHNASANRSLPAFMRNPAADRAHFPEYIDPQVTVLRLRQGTTTIGEITWFSTHGTSLTDANTLISVDNKGFASALAEQHNPGVVAAFPQTNAGDLTPNLWLRKMHPGGPTADHRTNCAIIGTRQFQAGQRAGTATRAMRGSIDYAYRFIDFASVEIDGAYTPSGRPARTTPAVMGAAAAATSTEDNTKTQLAFLNEGMVLPFAAALGVEPHTATPDWVLKMQSPKVPLFPLGFMPPHPWIQQVVPIQIIRLADLVLACTPAEFTIVAGLRVRRIIASALSVSLDNVLLQGYSNAYSQYVTTPEEYLSQQYEGGETVFGRFTLCAYMQEFDRLAKAMATGHRLGRGPTPPDTGMLQPDLLPAPAPDTPLPGKRFGDIVRAPKSAYRGGETVSVDFCGAYPTNRIRRIPAGGITARDGYFVIERFVSNTWVPVADDDSWHTELRWQRPPGNSAASLITIEWRIPSTASGRHRIRYFGDAKTAGGSLSSFTGISPAFEI